MAAGDAPVAAGAEKASGTCGSTGMGEGTRAVGVGPIPLPVHDVGPLSEVEAELIRLATTGGPIDLGRRPLRAVVLKALLSQALAGASLPAEGLRLSRAIIHGTLDLEGLTLDRPIVLRSCRLEASAGDGALILRDARLERLAIQDCTVEGAIVADRLATTGDATFSGSLIRGAVIIESSRIGGMVSFEGAEIGDGATAIIASGAKIAGPLMLRRAKAAGEIQAARSQLDSGVFADGIRISATASALRIDGARIGGDFDLTHGDIRGTIDARNVRVDGCVTAGSLTVDAVPVAFDAAGLDVGQDVKLDEARLRGTLRLAGASVGKGLRGEAIEIDGGETSIEADLIRVAGNCEFPRARLIGQLKLPGARIEGQLRLTEARIYGHEVAMRADGARIGGGCFLSRATILGLVRLPAAEIGNQFRLRGASIKVECGAALLASGARFGRDVELTEGCETIGAVVLDQAKIAGALDLSGSYLTSAALARAALPAPPGPVAHDETVISLVDAGVTRLVMPQDAAARPKGVVDLSRLSAGTYEDYADAWPATAGQRATGTVKRAPDHLVLDGFRYDHLANPDGAGPSKPADRTSVAGRRVVWLEAQAAEDLGARFKPQAWVTLSEALERQGFRDQAVLIDIARRRRERRATSMPSGARWQNRLLDWLALYGHNPWRTVAWMTVVVILFAGIWGLAARQCTAPGCLDDTVFVVRNKDAYRDEAFARVYPHFHAVAYSFDVFVPFVSFGYEDHWRPNLEYGPLIEVPLPFDWPMASSAGAGPAKPPTIAITIGVILYVLGIIEALLGLLLTSLMVTGFTGLLQGKRG